MGDFQVTIRVVMENVFRQDDGWFWGGIFATFLLIISETFQ
jgi:hypothetical protein